MLSLVQLLQSSPFQVEEPHNNILYVFTILAQLTVISNVFLFENTTFR